MREITKKLILLFFVVFFMLFLLEIVIRFFSPLYVEQSQFNEWYEWEHIKNHESVFCSRVGGEFCTEYKINSKGLRDYDYDYESNEKRRVLFLGDSLTVGEGVEMEETFAKIIEKRLLNAEVINGAIRGTGPENYWLFYKYELYKYNPDTVIIGFFPENDLIFPRFVDISVNKKKDLMIYKEDTPIKPPGKMILFRMWLAKKSYFYNFVILKMFNAPVIRDTLIKFGFFVPLETPNCAAPLQELNNRVDKTMVLFKYFNNELKKNGKELAIVIIPDARFVYDDVYLKYKEKYNCSEERRYYEYDRIKNICEEYDLSCLDLTPFLVQKNSQRLYHKYNGHLNKLGNIAIADILLNELEVFKS